MPIYRLGEYSPDVDPHSWIAPNANVIGQVKLARNVSIWWNATLRGDKDRISIDEESNIQDGCVLHTDFNVHLSIGRQVTVGHMVMLHGCTIGDRSLIGMGSVVLSGAVIGAGCLVAGGAVVLGGTIVPDGSLVAGVPAKVRRELTSEERADILRNAEIYRAHSATHAQASDVR